MTEYEEMIVTKLQSIIDLLQEQNALIARQNQIKNLLTPEQAAKYSSSKRR